MSSLKLGVSDGIKVAIGYQIGICIGNCVSTVFRWFKMGIALYIMFQIGEAIKSDQVTRSHQSAFVHSVNK